MKIQDKWIPSVALGAVVLLVVSAVAISKEGQTFERTLANQQPVPMKLPNGLTKPGLAMEMADSRDEQMVLDAGVDKTAAPAEIAAQQTANRHAMAWMQYWDFPFIVGYVTLFAVIARRARILGFAPLKLIAFAAGFTAIAAGLLDILEDIFILVAVKAKGIGVPSIRPYGWSKWSMVFVTMLLESSVFFAWSSLATTGRILSLLVGGGFFCVSLLGLQSMLLQCDSSLETDAEWLVVVFSVLAIFTAWRFVHSLRMPKAPPPAVS